MPRPFRFGVVAASAPSHAAWIATARRVEELGYATLLMPDRTSVGTLSPFPALAVAAQATTTLRFGSYVFCNGYRHPVMLAREAATLDMLSDGRFELGLGTGVSGDEFQRMGLPYGSPGTRLGQIEETLQLLKLLFTEDTVTFNGKYYTVTELKGRIRTAQQPYPPLLVSGAKERMLKLAAREANIIAIGSRIGQPGDASLEQKIAWINEAAGPRAAELELSQTIFDIEISDSSVAPAPQSGGWVVTKRSFTIEQAVAHLLEQRELYGFSYLQISQAQMENFAPVAAQLNGK